jgi:hypothetical protein
MIRPCPKAVPTSSPACSGSRRIHSSFDSGHSSTSVASTSLTPVWRFFPDGTNVEFGVLVTPDRRVCEFLLLHGSGDVNEQSETATISDWNDKTDWWESTPDRSDIQAAMSLLDEEQTP